MPSDIALHNTRGYTRAPPTAGRPAPRADDHADLQPMVTADADAVEAAAAAARDKMMGPLLGFVDPSMDKQFWGCPESRAHLVWLDKWGVATR